MKTKKYSEFLNELNRSTYIDAAKKLKDKGHIERSEQLISHNNIHYSKMLALKNYPDLNPFEVWSNNEFFPDNTNKSSKLTIYLIGWDHLPANENDCEIVMIRPVFMFNSKIPFIGDLDKKEHFKGIDDYLEFEDVIVLLYSNDKASLYSCNDQTNYYKFTNRRDAVRFKKLIETDTVFMTELVETVKGCDELNPFLIQKEFVNSIKINDLYI